MDGVDLYRELAFQALLIADWKQTRQIARAPDRYFERNPILGNHPSVGRVDTYMFAAGVLHWVIAANLSPKWRQQFQLVSNRDTGKRGEAKLRNRPERALLSAAPSRQC
jgi:hypothetical protein